MIKFFKFIALSPYFLYKLISNLLKLNFYRNQHFLNRHLVVYLVGFIFVIIIIINIIIKHNDNNLQKKAIKQTNKQYLLPATRGIIFDRNNVVIAGNIINAEITIDPSILPSNIFSNIDSVWQLLPTIIKNNNIYVDIANIPFNIIKDESMAAINNNYIKLSDLSNKFSIKHYKKHYYIAINPISILANILPVNSNKFNKKITIKQKQCDLYNQKYKELLQKNYTKLAIKQKLKNNKITCSRYYKLKKSMIYPSGNINKLIKFITERKLICRIADINNNIIKVFFKKLLGKTIAYKRVICRKGKITGINIKYTEKRFYPQADILTPVIGVVNKKNIGIFGIEKSFNKILTGVEGFFSINKDNNSWRLYYDYNKITQAINGTDIKLTIDTSIQFYLFNAIKNSVIRNKAQHGSGIILNKDGEILAMVSYPTTNPNLAIKSDNNYSFYLNRVLASSYDIASTIKPFIALLALDKDKITLDEIFDLRKKEGNILPNKRYPALSVTDIIKKSNNLGIIKISKKLKAETIYNTWRKLGFGQSLGVLPGIETIGILKHYYNWGRDDKRNISFGYGPMTASIAQLAKAYLVFVNNGTVVDLKLFKNFIKSNKKQVFSKINTNKMIAVLEKVIKSGTGKYAKLFNIIAAGKTGTGRIRIKGKYSKKHHNTFFAGFAPSQQAKYIMVINIHDPQNKYQSGGSVAAPVFKEVMSKLLTK